MGLAEKFNLDSEVGPQSNRVNALNLRVSSETLEILNTLNKIYLERTPVTLWQNTGRERIVRIAYIRAIDYSAGKLLFAPLEKGKVFDFNGNLTVYIRGREKSILFKTKSEKIDTKRVIVNIPTEVRMYEMRAFPRLRFGFGSTENILFEIRVNQTSAKFKEFLYPIFDLSKSGVSMLFNAKESVFFNVGETILIHKIADFKVPAGMEAKIIYTKKVEFITGGHRQSKMKIGIGLKRHLSDEVFESIHRRSLVSSSQK